MTFLLFAFTGSEGDYVVSLGYQLQTKQENYILMFYVFSLTY